MRQKISLVIVVCLGFASNLFAASDYQELNRVFSQGDFQKLIELAETQTKKDPSDINAIYFGGRSYLRLNNYDKGMQYLLKFEKLHDEIELAKKKEATKDPNQDFLWIDAYYFPAYYLLGEYYVKNSNFSKAERNLRRAKSGYFNDRMLNFYLGLSSLELKKYEEAHKYFRRMIELDPKEPSPYYNIASTYARQGKPKDAIEWLTKAVQANPAYKKEAAADKDFTSIKNTKEFESLVKQ
jgi:tetratricopeptide (TPR) repeat protein